MGAIAISQSDEKILKALQKKMGVPSKSQMIHRALEALQKMVAREQLAEEIRKSVRKCAKADGNENQSLTGNY
ncbi:MAG: hypothetical protein HQM15_11880 [Deltaproteobacteria bacterium]|nr:hypothetical protein [Deltaproteobacteria bacterium]